MINYLTTFVNTDGNAYPDTAAVNSSGPGTTDGTEFVKAMIDDLWGYNQALLDYTDDTPSGSSEAAGASQRLDSILKIVSNVDTVSAPASYTVEEWNKNGVLVLLAGATSQTLSAGVGADRSNKIIVYNLSGSSSTINTGAGPETLENGRIVSYIYDGSSAFVRLNNDYYTKSETDNKIDFPLQQIQKEADYTILDADVEDVFRLNPNTVSQYGKLTLTLNATGSNTSKVRRAIHGANSGLCAVDANGSQKFLFNNQDYQQILLYMPGQYIDYYWDTGIGKWIVIDYKINMPVLYQSRSDWTSAQIGNGVKYDTKSGAIDFTGQVITFKDGAGDTGNTCTATVIYDSGGTGLSGTLYFYDVTGGLNVFPDGNTITASDGTTSLVNEISGSNKNQSYSIYHGFNINKRYIRKYFAVSTDKTEANILFDNDGFAVSETGGNQQGLSFVGVDINSFILIAALQSIRYVQVSGGTTILTGDYYADILLEF